jgi:hypothetical protein
MRKANPMCGLYVVLYKNNERLKHAECKEAWAGKTSGAFGFALSFLVTFFD